MKQLIPILALCFCMVQNTFAQDDGTVSIGQYSAKLAHSGYDTVAQSFLLEESAFVESFRLSVFSRYSAVDHPGVLSVIEGDGPYGEVVFQVPILVKSLNKFFPEEELETLTIPEIESLWAYEIQGSIDSEERGFEEMSTTFTIGRHLPSGEYTVMVSLDTSITHLGHRWITSFTNCYDWPCANPYNVDPYSDGTFYGGINLVGLQIDERDMAFEVRFRPEITTSVGQSSGFSELKLPMRDGVVTIPDAFAGWHLLITDLIGRELVAVPSLVGGQSVNVESMINQVVIVRLLSKEAQRKTAKILVH